MRFGNLEPKHIPKAIANELHARGLKGWRVGLTTFIDMGVLGICNYTDGIIWILHSLAFSGCPEAIEEVVLHEMAHAIAGYRAGHGPKWVQACADIGLQNATAKFNTLHLLPNSVARTIYTHRLCFNREDGTIEELPEYTCRPRNLRNSQVTGRPETAGKLFWNPL